MSTAISTDIAVDIAVDITYSKRDPPISPTPIAKQMGGGYGSDSLEYDRHENEKKQG